MSLKELNNLIALCPTNARTNVRLSVANGFRVEQVGVMTLIQKRLIQPKSDPVRLLVGQP
jgi:hypothetical protein